MMLQPPTGPRPSSSEEPERRRASAVPAAPLLAAVRDAWQTACAARDPRHPALALSLATFARDGRARGVPVEALLRALDAIVRPADGETALDFGDAREWAGTRLIGGYYAADQAD